MIGFFVLRMEGTSVGIKTVGGNVGIKVRTIVGAADVDRIDGITVGPLDLDGEKEGTIVGTRESTGDLDGEVVLTIFGGKVNWFARWLEG